MSVTSVPEGNDAEHVPGQSIPAGSLRVCPFAWTVKVGRPGSGELWANAAETPVGASIRSVHGPVPADAHGPSQAANRPESSGTAVSVIFEPVRRNARHESPTRLHSKGG